MGDTILRVDDIQKFYGNKGNLTKAIDHISFSVRKGEFLGIMGASGSGKTTLLNCISTIDTVTSGHIYVEEKDITMLHRAQLADFRGKKLGFIFQNFNLLDTLTAYENISLALSIAGAKPSEIEQRIPQIAQALNIQDVLGKYPYQMSGGQQQRVAAARAMVTNPAIVLADEPTGALDSNSSRMLLTMLTELNERLSATILMVTHDAFSASYCNRILFIKDGQVFNELHRGTDVCFRRIIENRPRPKNEPMVDGKCGFLFLDQNGNPTVAMHWEHYFNHICTSYNKLYREQLPNITPHVCRHTFCSNMAKSGMNPKTLQYLMGHSDIGVTLNTYTHVQYDDVETEMKRVVNAE